MNETIRRVASVAVFAGVVCLCVYLYLDRGSVAAALAEAQRNLSSATDRARELDSSVAKLQAVRTELQGELEEQRRINSDLDATVGTLQEQLVQERASYSRLNDGVERLQAEHLVQAAANRELEIQLGRVREELVREREHGRELDSALAGAEGSSGRIADLAAEGADIVERLTRELVGNENQSIPGR